MAESFVNEKPVVKRFEMDAEDTNEILTYFKNRTHQMLSNDDNVLVKWDGNYELVDDWGVKATFVVENIDVVEDTPVKKPVHRANKLGDKLDAYSIYVRNSKRNQGHMTKYIKTQADKNRTLVTVHDCDLENYLSQQNIKFLVADKPRWKEYLAVEKFYGDHTAARTGVHMINHIDEGLHILKRIGASELAMRAYCLHPLLQGDIELKLFYDNEILVRPQEWDMSVVSLALEYRNIANAYLSHKPSTDMMDLSPIEDVNYMLVADKIQNRKDFEIYHKGTHAKSDRLVEYFGQWLRRLNVSEDLYQRLVTEMIGATGGEALKKGAK
jgi:hypothetical protein